MCAPLRLGWHSSSLSELPLDLPQLRLSPDESNSGMSQAEKNDVMDEIGFMEEVDAACGIDPIDADKGDRKPFILPQSRSSSRNAKLEP
mmetsp:Transcript_39005/g.72613  ORF Transcript_39005/g.72613 Transcript_39005/m.72613 type:complete len:89 (-) Transcript_39005:15-281(-)